ncbi:MAG: hypothetical protein R2942_12495 [Ignavibacteria bacterium]
MSSDFYNTSILPFAGIIIKLCRAYTKFARRTLKDYYQEVCFADLEEQRKLSGGIAMEHLGLPDLIKCLSDLT